MKCDICGEPVSLIEKLLRGGLCSYCAHVIETLNFKHERDEDKRRKEKSIKKIVELIFKGV